MRKRAKVCLIWKEFFIFVAVIRQERESSPKVKNQELSEQLTKRERILKGDKKE
jgi:hypothetical protein